MFFVSVYNYDFNYDLKKAVILILNKNKFNYRLIKDKIVGIRENF